MTDPNYSAILLIVDRSGSMGVIREASQDAINEFITGQATQPGRRTIRLNQFDSHLDTVFPSTDALMCPKYVLAPRGGTALYDAIGFGIEDFGRELAALGENERPGSVVVGIMTDGAENSSHEYSRDRIKEMIEHQQVGYRWKFLFMGANQDAVLTASFIGLNRESALTYTASSVGARSVVNTFNTYAVAAASGIDYTITDDERNEAQQ